MTADLVTIAMLMAQLEQELEKCSDDELYNLVRCGVIGQAMAQWVRYNYPQDVN